MKTKYWIMVIAVVLFLCLGLSIYFMLPGEVASHVQVYADNQLMHTLPLDKDTQITVTTQYGTNVITVKNGKVAVTEASCPDHYCMERGYQNSGTDIVCLPNRLVLKFTSEQTVDTVVR